MLLEKRQQKDLVTFSPNNCNKNSSKIRTVKEAINLPSKSLSDFFRQYGRDWVIGYVSAWVIDLNDDSNVKTKMTDSQMEFTATRIVDEYRLKVTDLTLFFRRVKEGKYGEYYENLSREKILVWLSKYFDERCEYAQMMAQSSHEKFSMSKDKVHPDILDNFKKLDAEIKLKPYKRDLENPNTLGKRTRRNVMKKDGEVTMDLKKVIQLKTTLELKNYLINFNSFTDGFDEKTYTLVELILDERNRKLDNNNNGKKTT
jgi:hypothetical protein